MHAIHSIRELAEENRQEKNTDTVERDISLEVCAAREAKRAPSIKMPYLEGAHGPCV